MLTGKKSYYHIALFACLAWIFQLTLSSCTTYVKGYPANKPFVFKTNINLEANLSKDEREVLASQLKNQLDDSLENRTVSWPAWKVLKNPPVYDSTAAERSVAFMKNLLHARGYLRDSINYDTTMDVKEDAQPPQLRTTVNFNVWPGKVFRLDSIVYNLDHPELQALTHRSLGESYIGRGEPFSTQSISLERERLVNIFRNNGYLRFTVDELVGVWDTLDVSLLIPATDPLEQFLQLQKIQQRIDTPTANLEIRLKPGLDEERLTKYFVGHTTIYPDRSMDTAGLEARVVNYDENYTIIYYRDLFKHHFLAQNIYFKRGDLYNQQKFLNTITRFNTMGAWRMVNIEQIPRAGTDTVDFIINLTPTEKYSFIANIEGSRNNNFILQENLLGLGFNAQWINRNFGRASNQSNTSFRYGTEVATRGAFVQTRQVSVSHSIIFPRPVPNVKWIPLSLRENFRTIFSFAATNIERRDFFNLTSINANWGYDFQWKNKTLSVKIPNVEYTFLDKKDSLIKLLNDNPSLRGVFNDNGLVLSLQAGFSIRGGKPRSSNIVRLNTEISGPFNNFLGLKAFDSLFRFVKLDVEYIRNIRLGKSAFVFRTFAGVGVAMETRTRKNEVSLPFFKQYFAGGPNSMRAWGIRTLGPGSSLRKSTFDNFRFGDIQFETNLEYRFPLTTIAGVPIHSAFFTDIGNVWFRKPNPDFPKGNFTIENFYRDLGVGIGTGIRVDFSFFLLRLDYGVKAKNPSPYIDNAAAQGKWFYNFDPLGGIYQLGINYPFIF